MIEPVLLPGEEVALIADAAVGQVSAQRQIGVAVAAAVVSLGQVTAIARPRPIALVMTDRRLLFVDRVRVDRHARDTVLFGLNPEGLRTKPYRGPSMNKRFDLEAEGMPTLRINFPLSAAGDAERVRAGVDASN